MRADGGAGRVSARRGLIKANLEGVVSWSPLFRDTFCTEKCGGSENRPESGSVRFSEVANVLHLQSVSWVASVVERLSASRRVRYGRFDCISIPP